MLIVLLLATVLPTYARTASVLGCFARAYDGTHLARHRDQIVKAVKLKIYPSPSDPAILWFAIQVQRRGEYTALHNEGVCKEDGPTMMCYIECDGGGVRITPNSNSTILMRLGIQPPFGPNGETIK